ncbi:glycosyltransferase family 2 protein [Microcoleus sp.]|uniref:glycosyltransferase n=1 Tax=Microcoleus sp. TaxID=44472 RepID=UPI003526432F
MNLEPILFSIIVPTYARPEKLTTCLQSFAKLEYPRDRFQVIVVNDSTEISLVSTVAPFQNNLNLILLTQRNSGPAIARNTGSCAATGKFLVFTDDDCSVAPNWLQTLENRFTQTPNSLIGGRIINALPDNIYSTASQELIDYLYSYYNAIPDRAKYFTSNNFALPAESFQKIGGFGTSFSFAGEDREFCHRWLNSGYNAIYAPEVIVYHAHKLTLHQFWQQQFNYGKGAFLFQQVTAQTATKGKLQNPSFYLNLLAYPWRHTTGIQKLLIAGLFLLSQVAIVAGLLWEKKDYEARKLGG